ncbi:hypothetical protein B7463_g10384, partial [Scytalidium lignicola]
MILFRSAEDVNPAGAQVAVLLVGLSQTVRATIHRPLFGASLRITIPEYVVLKPTLQMTKMLAIVIKLPNLNKTALQSAIMSESTNRQVYRRSKGSLQLFTEPIQSLKSYDVLIKVQAVSLNWKDGAILTGRFPWPTLDTGIPGTEFAGEVIQVGDSVKLFKVGSKVVSMIDLLCNTGNEIEFEAVGQSIDGTLATHLVLPQHALVEVPDYLSWEEASILACAGLTAWNAVDAYHTLAGKTVLIQGTGGVSSVCLLLATKLGARIIITSSSDEKLEKAKTLGATLTINYKTLPNWEVEVMRLTEGIGADIVIDQGGASTLLQSVRSLKKRGSVSQVGLLTTKSKGDFRELGILLISKACHINGIQVGTKADFENFVSFLKATKMRFDTIIDQVFDFQEANKAFDYLIGGNAFGKVVIKLYTGDDDGDCVWRCATMAETQLHIPNSENIVRVRIVDTRCWFTIKAESFIEPAALGQEFFEVPDLAFLIEHEVSGKKLMFDLGVRKDYWNLPAVVLSRLGGGVSIPSLRVAQDATEVLEENGIGLAQIGNVALFPPSTSLIVGPGFKASPTLMPGYPNHPNSPVPADAFANRELREIDFSTSALTIGGFRAVDFFLDGSFYLLDTPGHCTGHICGLACTTPEPESTFVFLGGDICHFAGCFRPSPSYPLPNPIHEQVLDQDDFFPVPCPASIFTDHHPQAATTQNSSFDSRTTPFHKISTKSSSAYTHPQIAQQSVDRLVQFDASPSVLVCFAHDPSLARYLPTMNSNPDLDLNAWKSSGWKERCHWDWLNLLPRGDLPGRKPVLDGYWRDGKPWHDARECLIARSGNVKGSGL